jgi:NAD(P)-dependent dehydrogenase (short-subunit alcohol dehydrogenase family)
MVSLIDVQSSNFRTTSTLPPGLVAVFVGGTSGIGETTLKQFAKHTRRPRIYFVGRSQEAGDRIAAECKALNSERQYIFIKGDTSLIRTVDDICRDIKSKEKSVNLLFLSMGTLITNVGMSTILSGQFNSHGKRFTRVRQSV